MVDISKEKQNSLSLAEARRILRYDPDLGKIFWNVRRHRCKFGGEAGSVASSHGYCVVNIKGNTYLVHRIVNLRNATKVQNGGNRRGNPRRGIGNMKGASFVPSRGTWRSSLKFEGKTRNLGNYPTELEAHQVYLREASRLFGEYARAA